MTPALKPATLSTIEGERFVPLVLPSMGGRARGMVGEARAAGRDGAFFTEGASGKQSELKGKVATTAGSCHGGARKEVRRLLR